jgi:hypothetical protein
MLLLAIVAALASCANPVDLAPTTALDRAQRACAKDADCVAAPEPCGECSVAVNRAHEAELAAQAQEQGTRCPAYIPFCCEVAPVCLSGECRLINPDFAGRCISVPPPRSP